MELTDPDKELSEINAEKEECPIPSRPIEDGTEESISSKRDMPQPVP